MKNLKDYPLKAKTRHFLMYAAHFICLLIAITILFPSLTLAAMSDYCLVPPYVKTDLHPNVMIMMDNSTIMGSRAYSNLDCTEGAAGCYIKTTTYFGLFVPNVRYNYDNTTNNRWEPSATGTYSGNLLNWLTTSQYDLVESILVGGKSASRITNINVIQSIGSAWDITLTYTDSAGATRVCIFSINNANIEIKDQTPNSCGYLDTPDAMPIPSDPTLSLLETDGKFAHNMKKDDNESSLVKAVLLSSAKNVFGFVSKVMDFIAGDAEAASTYVKIDGQGNTTDITSATECTGGYTFTFTATENNTVSPYAWSIVGTTAGTNGCAAGTYPISATTDTGLCLNPSTGLSTTLTGSARYANIAGSYTFTVRVQDSKSGTPNSDTHNFRIQINNATVTITTTDPMLAGNDGAWYRQSVIATGNCVSATDATKATTWTVTGSTLPGTLSFPSNPSPLYYDRKDVTGTPSAAGGPYAFTANVRDAAGNTASELLHITINPAVGAFQITTPSPLTDGTKGDPYQATIATAGFTCSGGCGVGWSWSISSGALPPGLSLNTAGACTGGDHVYITGTPTTTGTYTFTVSATTNPAGCGGTATKIFTLTIGLKPPTVRTSGNLNVKLCAGNATCNCNNDTSASCTPGVAPCSSSYTSTCVLKSGIVDQFWPQARFGVESFTVQAVPRVEKAIDTSCSSTPPSDFYTAIENATPTPDVTPLVDGEHEAVNYYATDTGNNTNPFRTSASPCSFGLCLKNFALILSAGVGADNPPNPTAGTPEVYTDSTNCGSANYKNLTKNSCYGYSNDLRPGTTAPSGYPGRQYLNTYIVNTMGTAVTKDSDGHDIYNTDNAPTNTGEILKQAALKGGGLYYEVIDPALLREALIQAFQDILKRAASGTAASVLASGEGSGANLIQAVFYPRRKIEDTEIAWIGRLTNLWYYVDPFFGNSTIRLDDGDKVLNLLTDTSHKDYIAELYYDSTTETTRARRYTDTNGDGVKDAQIVTTTDIPFELAGNLWEAGTELWKRSSARTIYTNCSAASALCIGTTGLMNFSTVDSATRTALRPYLQAADDNEAEAIIRYVHGEEDSFVIGGTTYSYRPRMVKADLNNDGDYLDTVDGIPEGTPRVWKLGDVLNSTPKISSWIPLNQFHRTYSDTTYGEGTTGGYINTDSATTSNYKNRGMVFTGSNDGVLHAFNLGKLELSWGGQQATEKARMTSPVTGTYGQEMWAFIPKNVLPYLTYQKENDYCHVYSVDLTPYVFDASINIDADTDDDGSADQPVECTAGEYWRCVKSKDSWRTILIGGMRYGGACRKTGSACTDCVKTPLDDPADPTHKGLGYSSYFALDITEQNAPKLLWEWDGTVLNTSTGVYENHLGFSTTGPAIVKINARTASGSTSTADTQKNGRWFAVVGSGPTGPVGASQQFMGSSDQTARVFIIDVKNGPTAGNFWEVSSGISSSFIGSMINANNDTDLDYQDDVVYVPYVNKPALGTTWTDGGILRLLTNEDLNGSDLSGSTGNTALNPGNWGLSAVVSGVGPMTSSVARLQNPKKGQLWLFGGTGRYYYEIGPVTDDETSQRHIFGIKDPCFSITGFDSACTTTRSLSDLTNVTDIANVPASPDVAGFNGWYISLDAGGNFAYTENGSLITRAYRAEREITDPLATTSGLVFFTTYKPYGDECAVGGKSFIWATKYDTGGAGGALLKGKALVQVSTGSIEQVNLSSAFTAAGGRKSYAMEGVPPTAQGLSILSTPPPIKRVLHIRER